MSTTFGLHRAVLFNGNGVATQFENRSLTWIETADRVARLAGALREFGVGRGDRVAILMLNQDRYLELYLATAWAGAVVTPLNIRWSAGENQACLTDCRPKLLVVDAAFAKIGEAMAEQLSTFALLYADDAPDARPRRAHDYEELVAAAAPIPDVEAPETDLAGIFYTGGTTGRSKGVMLSHRNLLSSARNALSFSARRRSSAAICMSRRCSIWRTPAGCISRSCSAARMRSSGRFHLMASPARSNGSASAISSSCRR